MITSLAEILSLKLCAGNSCFCFCYGDTGTANNFGVCPHVAVHCKLILLHFFLEAKLTPKQLKLKQ